ncbi:MAG: D-alanine--D-alanine ligase [Candidatus Cloacimonetes bacterium]|nr:D-alanine--D-alanine ligase [Candidatus Cloacimonadota bacterium]
MSKIIVLLGGKSPEREVSLITGTEIAKQLGLNGHQVITIDPADFQHGDELVFSIRKEQADFVFIGLHGGEGENGILQAMLDGSQIPYTGSGFKASAVAMDKILSKYIAQNVKVPYAPYAIVTQESFKNNQYPDFQQCLQQLSLLSGINKIVVKPADAGSSVGVHIVADENQWQGAISDALSYSDKIIAEVYIEGRELTVTVLNGKALPVVEIKPHKGFYDYPNKYNSGNTDYQSPAMLTEKEAGTIKNYAIKIWQAMDCSGYARIDFRYDGKEFYFLEVNTLPGMTPLSLTPMAAKAEGMNFGDLLEQIIAVVPAKKYFS